MVKKCFTKTNTVTLTIKQGVNFPLYFCTITCCQECVCLTLSSELIFDSFYASFLLNEIVDDLRGLLILQLSLRDTAHIKQVLQLRVQVV